LDVESFVGDMEKSLDERDGVQRHSPPLLACHEVRAGFHHVDKTLVKEEKNGGACMNCDISDVTGKKVL